MKKTEKKSTDQELADLLLKRDAEKRERVARAEKAINEICQKESVAIIVAGMQHDGQGRWTPLIQLAAIDNATGNK